MEPDFKKMVHVFIHFVFCKVLPKDISLQINSQRAVESVILSITGGCLGNCECSCDTNNCTHFAEGESATKIELSHDHRKMTAFNAQFKMATYLTTLAPAWFTSFIIQTTNCCITSTRLLPELCVCSYELEELSAST